MNPGFTKAMSWRSGPILFRLEALDENPETIGAPASPRAGTAATGPARQRSSPVVPAAAGPPRSSGPDSDIDLVPLDDD